MQPLLSPVDSPNQNPDEELWFEEASFVPGETTPLLPRRHLPSESVIPFFAIILALLFVVGISIGVYLLVEEERPWNANFPFHLIPRLQWSGESCQDSLPPSTSPASSYLLISQTGTPQCFQRVSCQQILQKLQEIHDSCSLPYNFLISSNGLTYEGLGFGEKVNLGTIWANNSISIGFIGNYTTFTPGEKQIQEIEAFVGEAIRRQKLSPFYKIIGIMGNESKPVHLFNHFQGSTHWDRENSDW